MASSGSSSGRLLLRLQLQSSCWLQSWAGLLMALGAQRAELPWLPGEVEALQALLHLLHLLPPARPCASQQLPCCWETLLCRQLAAQWRQGLAQVLGLLQLQVGALAPAAQAAARLPCCCQPPAAAMSPPWWRPL